MADLYGNAEQSTQYYPFGMVFEETNRNKQAFKFGGKELDMMNGLNWYDFVARGYDPVVGRFLTPDPLAEKYPWVSSYAYCMNNPVRYIDPDGRDIWEINEMGEIIKRMKDKMQDAFYMVAKDAEGKYQRTFTTDADGNKNYNSISFEYGTVEKQFNVDVKIGENLEKVDLFQIKGDDNATQLFEFLSNPGKTTNVEWSHAKIGNIVGENGKNMIGTSHDQFSTVAGAAIMGYGYSMRELNHNHPSGSNALSPGDLANRTRYLNANPNIKLNIYTTITGYRPYTTLYDITNPTLEIVNRQLRLNKLR